MNKTYSKKDFVKHKNFCIYPFVQLYGLATEDGFRVKPCCESLEDEEIYTDSIESIKNHNFLKNLRKHFIEDNPLPESICRRCIDAEMVANDTVSRRLRKPNQHDWEFEVLADGTLLSDPQDLDLRPNNTCNLKCMMCNPWDSSKWMEDMDIYGSVFLNETDPVALAGVKKKINQAKQYTDWDELLEIASNLKRLFIAGGEPFHMKNAVRFLQTLVDNGLSQHIVLEITTNAVKVTDTLITLLEKFEEVFITISIDGVSDVNYIVRYPTDWDNFCSNVDLFYSKFPADINFNHTVSALNLLDTFNIIEFTNKYVIHPTKLIMDDCIQPDLLTINSLKPDVIVEFRKLLDASSISITYNNWYNLLIDGYKFNEENNIKLKEYLSMLDNRRNTNSKEILPWCWV
tara:strand:+ start:371 stop:1576 length:1206 start_codon:yes stop_codon:yes gene_type:complete